MSTAHELVDAVGIRDGLMQRELDKAWEALPGRTLIQTRGHSGALGFVYKDDRLKGTYIMSSDWWCCATPLTGMWSRVDEIRDFVVIARDVDPRTREGAVLKLCGYKKDKAGNVVPIK